MSEIESVLDDCEQQRLTHIPFVCRRITDLASFIHPYGLSREWKNFTCESYMINIILGDISNWVYWEQTFQENVVLY